MSEADTSKPRRTIIVVDYDPAWPHIFAELAQVIAEAVGALALRIEHVGSTSVPGLAAKPIVDLNVVIEDRALLPDVVRALATLGYEHRGDQGIPGREAFRGLTPNVPRAPGRSGDWPPHHLYVCAQDNLEHHRQIAFRDYLRTHPDEAAAYGQLKRELAARHPHDIDAYIAGKGPFIGDILRRAMGADRA